MRRKIKIGVVGADSFSGDFVRAVVDEKLPPNNAWDAARYMIPGIIAHESSLRDGELMDVPDFGPAPADWARLEYTKKDHYEE